MQILEQKQKPFTTVILRSSSHRVGRWCQKERPVICFSVIESGEPKSGWSPEDQKCRRKRPPVEFKQRCIKGREIRTPLIVFILKCYPCRIDNEGQQPNRRKKKDQSTRYLYGMFPETTDPVVHWKYCFAWVLVMDDSNATEHKGHYTLTR